MELEGSSITGFDPQEYEFGKQISMPTIETLHYKSYSLETYQHEGLRCNSHINHYQASVEIPQFGEMVDVIQTEDKLLWSFILPQAQEENVSFKSDNRNTPFYEKHKMRHEFVSETFGNTNTDVKLSSVFLPEGDDNDVISPDFGFKDHNDIYHFLEIGTTLATNLDQIDKVVAQKLFKYQDPIEVRLEKTTSKIGVLTAVIVSPRTVASNITLPHDVVNELIMRMNIMMAVENTAIGKGIKIKDEESESRKTLIQEMILTDMLRVEFDSTVPTDSAVVITKDYYNEVVTRVVDKEKIMRDYTKELNEESKRLIMEKRNEQLPGVRMHSIIKTLREEMNEGNRRSYKKPIVLFPFVNPRVTKAEVLPKYLSIGSNAEIPAVVTAWNKAFGSMVSDVDWHEDDISALRSEAYEADQNVIEEAATKRKENRSMYHRVNVGKDMTTEELRILQSDGVWAKSTRNEAWRKERLKEQRSGFTWDTDTSDIHQLISNSDKLWEALPEQPDALQDTFNLINDANNMIGNSSEGLDFCKSICSSRMGNFCDWISDLAMELAISNKQHCKKNYMILKKLRYYDVYVLLLPTTSSSHCFFSLLFPYLDVSTEYIDTKGVFRKIYNCGNCHVTDFVSMRCDKIENIAASLSNLINSSILWCHFHDKDAEFNSMKESTEIKKMIMTTLLISLEDKAETEETVTLTRYQYMELLKSNFTLTKPDPLKMVEKFNKFPRSRLNLYFMKRIIIAFDSMTNNPPKRIMISRDLKSKMEDEEVGDNSPPDDSWNGLYNWITGTPIKHFSRVVNLFYLGYFKNKNEMSQSNSDLKLIEKALEEEYKINFDDKKALYGDPVLTPKGKQFSLSHLIFGCNELEARLKSTLGPNYKENLKNDCLEALAEQLTHEIATLKASSSISHNTMKTTSSNASERVKEEINDVEDEPRIKVIEAIHNELKLMGLNPFTRISTIIKEIETTSNGVIADLFKKQQHGGLREIYVLTIKSRIVQLFIEILSRSICRKFDEETLTHPKNKLVIIDEHKSKASRLANSRQCIFLEMNSSSDKTRWNQNFIMTAMCVPLFRLLPKEFHPLVQRILNLWARKKLRIPSSVLKMIYDNIPLNSKTYTKLEEDFWSKTSPASKNCYAIFQPNISRKFISLTSGMMQGILHYTSSLLHLSFLYASSELIRITLHTAQPNCKFLISKMCSSDDSAMMITGFSEIGKSTLDRSVVRMARNIEMSLFTLTRYCQYFCMKESVKSTTAVPNYVEFNSEFVCSNTLSVPYIKMMAACTNLTESESFSKRFQNQYNLLSDLFNSGFPARYSHISQISQAMLHYKTMGQNLNPLYHEYSSLLRQLPHPKFGFFPMDCSLMPGVMGYSFCLWNVLSLTNQLKINKRTSLMNNLEMLSEGSIVESLNIMNGDVKRWRKLVDKLSPFSGTPEETEVEEFFRANSEIFFNHPQNMEELKVKLYLKSLMPGVAQSMNRGNQFLQSLVLSVYSITTHCFTSKSVSKEVVEGVTKLGMKRGKTSLLREIERELVDRSNLLDDFTGTEDEFWSENNVTLEEERLLFPNCDRYKEVIRIIRSFKNSILVRRPPYRHRKNQIVVQPKVTPIPLTLMQTVRKLWYGHSVSVSKTVFKRCLEFYKIMFPWISGQGFIETLKESPFQTAAELYAFVATQSVKSRRVVRIGPPLFSNKFSGQIVQLISKSQREGYMLKRQKDRSNRGTNRALDSEQMLTKLTLALLLPGDYRRQREVIKILTHSSPLFSHISEIPNMTDKLQKISYIQAYAQKSLTAPELVTSLRKSNRGVFLSFLREQQKVTESLGEIKWKGEGIVLVIYEDNIFKLHLFDDLITKIEVQNWSKIKNHPSVVKSIIGDLLHCKQTNVVPNVFACAKYSSGRFLHASQPGIPIVVNSDMDITYFEPKTVNLEVTKGRISLTHKAGRVKVPIISYRSNSYDLNQYNTGEIVNDCWKAWVEQKSWAFKDAMSRLIVLHSKESVIGKVLTPSEETEKVWLRETLLHRLNYKKVGHSMTTVAESLITNDSAFQTDDLEDYDMDDILQSFMEVELGLDYGSQEESARLTIEEYSQTAEPLTVVYENEEIAEYFLNHGMSMDPELNNMAVALKNGLEPNIPHSEEVNEKNLFSFMYIHCLWDNFINTLEEMNPQLLGKTLSAIRTTTDSDTQDILFWLFGTKPKQRELSIMERFLVSKGDNTSDDLPNAEEMYEEEEEEEENDMNSTSEHT